MTGPPIVREEPQTASGLSRVPPVRFTNAGGWPGLVPEWIDLVALRDVAPILVSLVPFGTAIGVALNELVIPSPLGVGASGMIYAGSAQLAAMDLLAGGAGLTTVLLTIVVINARLLMYGAALEPMFRDQPAWFRWLAPQFIIDQSYALAMNRPESVGGRRGFRRYWLTVGSAIGVVWLGAIGTSLAVAPVVDAESPLSFAGPALFIGLLAPLLGERRALVAAGGAALVATFMSNLPNGLGLLAGILAGIASGSLADRMTR